jgi:hypothetical protein
VFFSPVLFSQKGLSKDYEALHCNAIFSYKKKKIAALNNAANAAIPRGDKNMYLGVNL